MKNNLLICIMIAAALAGCTSSREYFPKNIEEIQVEFIRFDNDLTNVRSESALQDIEILYDKYPIFMPRFVEDILGINPDDTLYLAQQLPLFLEDTVYGFKATNLREKELFADVSDIEKSTGKALSRIHYLYPEWILPDFYLFISGFNSSILFIDDDIAIGADMYLGSDYEFYNRVVYDYQKNTMRKECIPADVISAYLFRNIPYTSQQNRLLDQMIYRGKIMYLLSAVFPDQPEYEIMGYTKEQWQWCNRNERAIWNLMMDKRDLFKTETIVLTSYLNDGPFTSEISQDSPARLGTWIGMQIAKNYMKNNPDVSMQQLMEEADAQLILEHSQYRP